MIIRAIYRKVKVIRCRLCGDWGRHSPQGFGVVYDSVGGANMTSSLEATALNGDVVTTVSTLELDLSVAHFKGLSIYDEQSFSLEEIGKARDYLTSGKGMSKVVAMI